MNINKAAKQLQALFQDTNKCVKGNWIAPETDEIVKILRDNLSGGRSHDKRSSMEDGAPTVEASGTAMPAQSLQPKPESWPEIAREATDEFCKFHTSVTTLWAQGCLEQSFYDAIDRSHAEQPQRSEFDHEHDFCLAGGRCKCCGLTKSQLSEVAQPQHSSDQKKEWRSDKDGTLWVDGSPYYIGNCAGRIAFVHNAALATQADRFHKLLDEVGAKNWGLAAAPAPATAGKLLAATEEKLF